MKKIKCSCGCGVELDEEDSNGRIRKFISGHNNRKYDRDDKYAYKKAWVKRNREWANNRRRKLSRKRKIILLKQLGSSCSHCGLGYNGKNGAVFEFHHKHPDTKSFGIGSHLSNKSLEGLVAEANKCILLCGNCHAIYHVGEY